MAEPTEDGRAERFAEYVAQIEGAFNDMDALGSLRSQIGASELDENDRVDLLSRIAQYVLDAQMEADPGERRGRGEDHGDPQAYASLAASTGDAPDDDLNDPADDDDLTGEWAPV